MDLLIKNGILLDLETGIETVGDVGITKGNISFVGKRGQEENASREIEAGGYYVLPGWIDFHTHLFTGGSSFGVNADLFFSDGVTMAVDMGTSGCANYEAFRKEDILTRDMKIKSYLNLSPVGQPGTGIYEPLDKTAVQEDRMEKLVHKYPEEICGIKVRISKAIVGELGLEPLRHAVELGDRWGLPVCVHTTDPPVPTREILSILRPGDIYSHVFHNKGMTILDEKGELRPEVLDAQKRGVILEVGHGKMNFSFQVAEKAMKAGLYPDVISSDATLGTYHVPGPMRSLSFVLSKFWNMGMPLHQVMKAVTRTPARLLGMDRSKGEIKEGYGADITICKKVERDIVFQDIDGERRTGRGLLCPAMTIVDGRIMYAANDCN